MTIFTDMVLHSQLCDRFEFTHINTVNHDRMPGMGRFNLPAFLLGLRNIGCLLKVIICLRPAIVYLPISPTIFGLLRDSLVILEAKLLKCKVIIHLHGGRYIQEVYAGAPGIVRALVWRALHRVDRAIVLHSALLDVFDSLVPRQRVTVVSNGIPDLLSEASHSKATSPGTPKVVTYLSNLTESKGYLDVIQAAQRITAERQDVRFVIAGGWSSDMDRQRVLKLVDDMQLAPVIALPGLVLDQAKTDLLLASDLFVFPSFYPYEGQPLVLLEAMAAGLPIITTEHGILSKMVIHERNGLIVPRRDPVALAGAIRRLLDDVQMRQRMGEVNRNEYLGQYTVERCMQRMEALFAEVLAG